MANTRHWFGIDAVRLLMLIVVVVVVEGCAGGDDVSDDVSEDHGFSLLFQSNREEMQDVPLRFDPPPPSWLSGTLIRNGLGLFESGGRSVVHTFDGYAKLSSWRFAPNGSAFFSTRFLDTGFFRSSVDAGTVSAYLTLEGPHPPFSPWERVLALWRGLDNMNVNVQAFPRAGAGGGGRDFVALSDYWKAYTFCPTTLRTLSPIVATLHHVESPGGASTLHHVESPGTPSTLHHVESPGTPSTLHHVESPGTPSTLHHVESPGTSSTLHHVESPGTSSTLHHVESPGTSSSLHHVESPGTSSTLHHVESPGTSSTLHYVECPGTSSTLHHVESPGTSSTLHHVDSPGTSSTLHHVESPGTSSTLHHVDSPGTSSTLHHVDSPGTSSTLYHVQSPGTSSTLHHVDSPGTSSTLHHVECPGTSSTLHHVESPGTSSTLHHVDSPGTSSTLHHVDSPGTSSTLHHVQSPGTSSTLHHVDSPGTSSTLHHVDSPGTTSTLHHVQSPGTSSTLHRTNVESPGIVQRIVESLGMESLYHSTAETLRTGSLHEEVTESLGFQSLYQSLADSVGMATFLSLLSTAHPLPEPGTDHHLTFLSSLSLLPMKDHRMQLVRVKATEDREVVASWPVDRIPYMHSFSVTKTHALLLAQPFYVNVACMLRRATPFRCLDWRGEELARLYVVELRTGRLRTLTMGNVFTMHHVNAYDLGPHSLVMDLSTYPDPSFVGHLQLPVLRDPRARNAFPAHAQLQRFHVDLLTGLVTRMRLTPPRGPAFVNFLDMPTINESRRSRHYCFVYGVAVKTDNVTLSRVAVVKRDLCGTGGDRSWAPPHHYPVEPVFIPRPGRGVAEDEGVVLVPMIDGPSRRSYLAILDARDLSLMTSADLPTLLPYSLHGRFFPDLL
ncbi:uncharacterized protein LOC143294236 [Babylonia areolata]|uniref:uncharacterized protein LOC143294236 n=1 Tax=Babylonia areolata TaxID=304850 RepID=UPI003FD16B1B